MEISCFRKIPAIFQSGQKLAPLCQLRGLGASDGPVVVCRKMTDPPLIFRGLSLPETEGPISKNGPLMPENISLCSAVATWGALQLPQLVC